MKKIISLLLALVMIVSALSLSACGKQTETTNGGTGDVTGDVGGNDVDKTYSLTFAMGAAPTNFNPHTWEMSNEDTMLSYITAGLVDIGYKVDENGVETYEWLYVMASDIEDITATYADNAKWGIKSTESGRVWKISLNPLAAWEDGTPINADTYIYSMKQLLNPAMQNYRANTYYTGSDTALWGGYSYFKGGKVTTYVTIGSKNYNNAAEAGVECYIDMYDFWGMSADCKDANGNSCPQYVAITDTVKYRDLAVEEGKDGDWISGKEVYDMYFAPGAAYESYAPDYLYLATESIGNGTWDEVGLLKVDDYTIIYITEDPVTEFYFNIAMTSIWLVHEGLYEANKTTYDTGLVVTTYGTAADKIMSYGPYKLTSFTDTSFVLEKNENFVENKDGKHQDQWQCQKITYKISSEHATNLLMFLSGEIDDIALEASDVAKYKYSDYLMRTDLTYTFRYIFCTDYEALVALENSIGDGSNKRALAYTDFRNAMSLAINRTELAAETTAGCKATYNLYNNLYYYDVENDPSSVYKYSDAAMAATLSLYGYDTTGMNSAELKALYDTITGYSVKDAQAKFQAAYDAMVAAGDYTPGQKINLTCYCSADDAVSADDLNQAELLNKYLTEATKGTGFEGAITVTFQTSSSPSRYDMVRTGQCEMARGAWGGAAFYPFSGIRCYVDPDYTNIHEASGLYYEGTDADWGGFDPTTQTLTINIDGKDITQTIQWWGKSINSGEYAVADAEIKLQIMAALEHFMLSNYYCIPIYSECEVSMHSMKFDYITNNYNIMYGYGGLRYIKFNYSDAEWADFVKSQNGQLNYE
ncbi:MAG: hypothetical protein IKV30_02060 [Clostridia bacterium]|nr:hypothetical protein [Clostridia bacterium]